MRYTDIDPERTRNPPKKSTILFEGRMENHGHVITRVVMRQYVEREHEELGHYSLLTVAVETDRGSVEMKYDEGFRGEDALESAAAFLKQYVGLGSLVNRTIIELEKQDET